MKKIVPFKKDILFKTNLAEIISISLDHELSKEKGNFVKGKFTVSGEYKMLETSINTENFSYDLPFTVELDDRYILDNSTVDIDDFYYEIINDNVLSVHIDVLIDNLDEKEVELEEKELVREELPLETGRCIEDEEIPPQKREDFSPLEIKDMKETYKSYTIYIVRNNDTIESIMQKYSVNKEILELYNDLNDIQIGDKIIIPTL